MPSNLKAKLLRCEAEIAEAERLLRAGHPDIGGLCLSLQDWANEKRLIEARIKAEEPNA